jgi:zinc and cadmium transporter
MIAAIISLTVLTLLAGLAPLLIKKNNSKIFHLALVFSGAYLLGITISHLMPELFSGPVGHQQVALWVIIGYFMQLLLDYFTSGVEHGHLHLADDDHKHGSLTMVTLLTAMGVHALLEGVLLSHATIMDTHQHNGGLLTGIILHKMPAAFALMSLIRCNYKSWVWPAVLMGLFSVMTPIGIFLGEQLAGMVTSSWLTVLFALVTGNFLHISTTIFMESSPGHKLNFSKLLVIFAGTALALLTEFLG